jgi:hypothetical protein
MPEKDEDGGPIDEYVTGTVTLARTCHTLQGLTLMGYTNFGHQDERSLVTLQDW